MTKYTNSDVNTLAAAIPAPYGPLTRVTDVNATLNYDDNGDAKIKLTSALASTVVWASRNELADADQIAKILFEAHSISGINAPMYEIFKVVTAVYAYLKAAAFPYSDAERDIAYNALRDIMGLVGMGPGRSNAFDEGNVTTITNTISGSGLSRTSTLVTTGAPTIIAVEWGDGATSSGAGPHSHTYLAGTYTIRAIAVGRKGVAQDVDVVSPA